MCTLTYIPKPHHGFLLVSNRDESVLRDSALAPEVYIHGGIEVIYPKDKQAGGTWVATASNGFTLCLLNGAFGRHERTPPYKHSRGLVVTDFFSFNDIDRFIAGYDFKGIEPFTLVIIQRETLQLHIREIRWDGVKVYEKMVDARKPQIWSSAMLYEKEVIAERERLFYAFLSRQPHPQLKDMLAFHHFGGTGDIRNDLLMNRDSVLQTLSITGIQSSPETTFVHYEDLLTQSISTKEVSSIIKS